MPVSMELATYIVEMSNAVWEMGHVCLFQLHYLAIDPEYAICLPQLIGLS